MSNTAGPDGELRAELATVLRLEDIELSFGDGLHRTTVLRDLDLALSSGEFVSLLGPSGVGKSTLLRVAMGLVAPTAGSVRRPPDRTPGRRGEALVFQDAKLLPWRRVRANVELGLEGLNLSRGARHARAMAALRLVGLDGHAQRYPQQLSGGQRQRVGVARALAVEPLLLLMDEPFGALDAITRATLQDELRRLWLETGKTVLFVTHDIDEAVYLSDRVVVLAGQPARVRGEVRIPGRTRDRADPELQNLAARLRAMLREPDGPAGWTAENI